MIAAATAKRAAIYLRVSDQSQKEQGLGLEIQLEKCLKHAEMKGWTVAVIYEEVFTRKRLHERPEMTKLRKALRAREIDIVLALCVDRLSGNQNHIAILDDECEQAGATLAFVTEDYENSELGRFIRNAKAFAAGLEREKIVERTGRGIRARGESGKLLGGKALYGYEWGDPDFNPTDLKARRRTHLVENLETAPIVQRIFQTLAEGGSANHLAKNLTAEGIATPGGKEVWTARTIISLVTNRNYTGAAQIFCTVRTDGKKSARPEDERVTLKAGTIPMLITPQLWETANSQLKKNRTASSRNNKNPEAFLLRAGIAVCDHCGKPLVCQSASRFGNHRYRTAPQNRTLHGCPDFSIVASSLDTDVWERVELVISDPNVLREALSERADTETIEADLASIERRLKALDTKQRNFTKRLGMCDDDTAMLVMAELESLAGLKREAQAERESVLARFTHLARVDGFLNRLSERRTKLDSLTYKERRDVLNLMGVSVRVNPANGEKPRYTVEMAFDISQWEAAAERGEDTEPWPNVPWPGMLDGIVCNPL